MKTLVILNREIIDEIEDMVYDILGYFDEHTYSNALLAVEFALGIEDYVADDYMYDIFDHFGIVYGHVHDDEIVEFIKNSRKKHGHDEWADSMIICDLKQWLSQR